MGFRVLLRRPRWEAAKAVLVLAGHRPDLLAGLVARVRQLAPQARVDLRIATDLATDSAPTSADSVASIRLEERDQVIANLKSTKYDVVAVLAEHRVSSILFLPLRLDSRSIVLFNEGLGHFRLGPGSLPALLRQFGLAPSDAGPLATLLRAGVRTARALARQTALLLVLLCSTSWIRVRGWLRQRRRALTN